MDLMLLRRRLMMETDLDDLFVYTIQNGYAYVTAVKIDKWYDLYGNYDIIIPNKIEGCPVYVVSN